MQNIRNMWQKLWQYIRYGQSVSATANDASCDVSGRTFASTLPHAKYQNPKQAAAEEEYVNIPLLLTAPDSYYKESPSMLGFYEKKRATQEEQDLAKLEYFRQQRVEIPLHAAQWTGRFDLYSPEIKHIDAAHADLSLEILLLQANTKLHLEEYCPRPRVYWGGG